MDYFLYSATSAALAVSGGVARYRDAPIKNNNLTFYKGMITLA